jgi:Fur family peroxide stress response transcriptional regulator
MNDFVQHCKRRRLSVTHQRLAIYEALVNSPEHPSAEQVFKKIHQQYPTISLATVYKTLETLQREGLISKLTLPHEMVARYDANLDRHHHLVCVACRKVEDFYDEQLDALSIPKKTVRGYQVMDHIVQVNGVCPSCQEKKRKSSSGS